MARDSARPPDGQGWMGGRDRGTDRPKLPNRLFVCMIVRLVRVQKERGGWCASSSRTGSAWPSVRLKESEHLLHERAYCLLEQKGTSSATEEPVDRGCHTMHCLAVILCAASSGLAHAAGGQALRVPAHTLSSRPTYRYRFATADGLTEIDIGLNGPEKLASSTAYAEAVRSPTTDCTGMSVWKAARPLCKYLAAHIDETPAHGPRVELGAGLGLCGITLAKLDQLHGRLDGNSEVVCTDGNPHLLSITRANAELNGVGDSVKAAHLHWGDHGHLAELQDLIGQRRPSLVIGSDITYNLNSLPSLINTILALNTQLTILAVRPRQIDEHGRSKEMVLLSELTLAAGLDMRIVHTEGTEPPLGIVYVIELKIRSA